MRDGIVFVCVRVFLVGVSLTPVSLSALTVLFSLSGLFGVSAKADSH